MLNVVFIPLRLQLPKSHKLKLTQGSVGFEAVTQALKDRRGPCEMVRKAWKASQRRLPLILCIFAVASLRRFPNSRVRGVGAQFPVLPIEGDPLDGIQIDAVEAAGVDHVVGGIRARAIEGGDAAVAAEVVQRALGAELIGRKIGLALDEAEPIRGDHVVKVALAPADGAVALADAGKFGSNLKMDASAVTGALVGFHLATGSHASLPNVG